MYDGSSRASIAAFKGMVDQTPAQNRGDAIT
jgi:hypothetical protein